MIGPDLLAALAAAPALPDAACAGRWELECGDWLDTLPPTKRPYGVVAGHIYHLPRPGRPAGTTRKGRKTA